MVDRHYVVRQEEMSAGERAVSEFHGLAFLVVSGIDIKHVAGDPKITKVMEFIDGDLRVKDGARQKYEIFTMDPIDFDLRKDAYLKQISRNEEKMDLYSR